MNYLRGAVFPYLIFGAVISGLTLVYTKFIDPYIEAGVAKVLSYFSMTCADGLGYWLCMGVRFVVVGVLAGGAVFLVQGVAGVQIPNVAAVNPLRLIE